ncbi:hypothetical protein ACFOW7_01010 [Chitinimonas lacunae]|uniref:LysM domain-containing protein n=1 Tax=Chitinimonas lacunae TaxID=1963018 RepID=A0ABV8MKY0_9NEIS
MRGEESLLPTAAAPQGVWTLTGDTQASYTWYDTRGQVVQSQRRRGPSLKPDGFWGNEVPLFGTMHQYDYDALGNKVEERTFEVKRDGAALKPVQKLDKVSGINNLPTVVTQTWSYYAGTQKLKGAVDLGGRQHRYEYNGAGELTQHSIDQHGKPTAVQVYRYHEAGWRVEVQEQDGKLQKTSRTRYDALGRAIRERLEQRDQSGLDGKLVQVQSEQATRYDALGRVELVSGPTMAVQYLYDARANRRAIFAMERENHGWTGQAAWYDYDGWGRETVEAGTLRSVTQNGVSRTVIRATDKRDRWDELGPEMALRRAAGQQVRFDTGRQVIDGRVGSHGIGVTPAEITYDGSGMRRKTVTDSSGQKTVYQYDGLGRLIESGLERGERSVNRRLYDSLGRSMQEETVQYRADGSVARRMIGFSWYDAEDRVVFQLNRQGGAEIRPDRPTLSRHEDGTVNPGSIYVKAGEESATRYTYVLDRLTSYQVDGGTDASRQTHTFTYQGFDSWREATHVGSALGGPAQTTTEYDAFGNVVRIQGALPGAGAPRYFINDADGRVLSKEEGLAKSQYLYAGGARVAVSGNAFTGSSVDLHYSAIQDPSRNATTQSSYIAQQGDTLRRIAQMVWGDGRLWYLIGEENGLQEADDPITAGTMLKLPRVLNAANDASVFTPHSASEVLGETSPALPAPPPPPKPAKPCGGYGQAIIMVVAAVIAAYTGQWVGGLLQNTFLGTTGAAIVGAAAGGAMGFIVNQAGNMAIGTQERFSWQAVGQAALRKAVTAGIGQAVGESGSIGAKLLPNAPEFFQDVATGAITGAVTDGLLSLTGLGHFSWRNVAAAAIAEPINKWVGNNLFGTQTTPGSILARDHHLTANFTHQLANGLVNRVAQIATHGEGRLDWVSLVGNAFGETLGNEVAGKSRAYQVPAMPRYAYRSEAELDAEEALRDSFMAQALGATNRTAGFVEIDAHTRIATNPGASRADDMLQAMVGMLENPVEPEPGERILLANKGAIAPGLLRQLTTRRPGFEVSRNEGAAQRFNTIADLWDVAGADGLVGMAFVPGLHQVANAEYELKEIERRLGYGARAAPARIKTWTAEGKSVTDYSATLGAYQQALRKMTLEQALIAERGLIKSASGQVREAHNAASFEKLKRQLREIAKPDYSLVKKPDGSLRYVFGSTNKGYGIDAQLSSEGVLSFEIRATNQTMRAKYGTGTEMFDDMMSAIGPERVSQIRGNWSRDSGLTTNLDQFNDVYQYTRDEFTAASETWTGKRAAKYGFEPEEVIVRRNNVSVIFGSSGKR